MTNEELIKKMRRARAKVAWSVIFIYFFAITLDLYLTITSETIKETALSQTPFAILLVLGQLSAISLIFYYLEKILVEMNAKS